MKTLVVQTEALIATLIFAVAVCASQTGASAVYTSNCAMCHGKTGSGDAPMGRVLKVKPFNDPTVLQMTDSALNDIVTNGKGRMRGYGTRLSSDQVASLIQYIHQLQGK